MKTVIQQLINSFEIDRMQSTYTKEQVIELLNFKLEDEKKQIIESYCEGCLDITKDENIFPRETSENYYNENYL